MKKALKLISYSITGLLIIMSIIFIFYGTKAIRNNEIISIFGKGYSVVVTDSMEPTIVVGEFIIITKISFDEAYDLVEASESPVLVYKSNRGIHIVHRAVGVTNGQIMMKGDNPRASIDSEYVNEANFVGIVKSTTMFFGIGSLLVNSRNLIFLVAILSFVVILIIEVMSILKQIKEKNEKTILTKIEKEKSALLESERAKLRQELEDELKNINKPD